MSSNFIKYDNSLSLICNHIISDFDYGVNTYIQICDSAMINAVNISPCDVWKTGYFSAEFAISPDNSMIEFAATNNVMLSNIKNESTPIDINRTIYYLL